MTHEERVAYHEYFSCEGITEQSERIASLEELVIDMEELLWETVSTPFEGEYRELRERMKKLEVRGHRLPHGFRVVVEKADER